MRLVLVAVAVVLLAGCGGSTSAPPATTAPPSTPQARALVRYLGAIRVQYTRLGVLSQEVVAALRGINSGRPDQTWDRAGRRLAMTATRFRRLASALAAMRVPRPLAQAQLRLAEGVGIYAEYVDGIRAALQVGIPAALASAIGGNIDLARSAQSAWGDTVERYAGRLDVQVPAWVAPGPVA
jgi:hypothetical protein